MEGRGERLRRRRGTPTPDCGDGFAVELDGGRLEDLEKELERG
jgi:hypothetical protein